MLQPATQELLAILGILVSFTLVSAWGLRASHLASRKLLASKISASNSPQPSSPSRPTAADDFNKANPIPMDQAAGTLPKEKQHAHI